MTSDATWSDHPYGPAKGCDVEKPLQESGRLSTAVQGDPKQILAMACKSGLEGIVAKKKGSGYSGTRDQTWLKVKCTQLPPSTNCYPAHGPPRAAMTGRVVTTAL
jgi:hypothetical protein